VAEQEVKVTNEVGLHARPAAEFIKAAGQFASDIKLRKGTAEANAKSMLSVLKLDVRQDDLVSVSASGADEDEALEALVSLIQSL
jgi:phosphotransferase system HPr (HPr) family protein